MTNSNHIEPKNKITQLSEQLAVANQTITHLQAMAFNVSHDLQNQMAGARMTFDQVFEEVVQTILALTEFKESAMHTINGFRNLVQRMTALHDEMFDLKAISHSIQRLNSCVKQTKVGKRFIDTSSGSMAMQLQNMSDNKIDASTFITCSMNAIIAQALNTFFFQKGEKKLVQWQKEESQDFKFKGDPILSCHIIWNLLTNALRAVKEAKKGIITIRLGTADDYNVLYFEDTAKGMPITVAKQIFEQFYTTSKKGHGLGLFLVKTVIAAYGGEITCKTKEHEYTTFILRFPKIKQ